MTAPHASIHLSVIHYSLHFLSSITPALSVIHYSICHPFNTPSLPVIHYSICHPFNTPSLSVIHYSICHPFNTPSLSVIQYSIHLSVICCLVHPLPIPFLRVRLLQDKKLASWLDLKPRSKVKITHSDTKVKGQDHTQ